MEALREKIRSRDERIQEEQEQKEKDRIEAAREKNRDRDEKLSSVKAAEQDMKEKRQIKILQKQEDAAKRLVFIQIYRLSKLMFQNHTNRGRCLFTHPNLPYL